MQGHLHEIDIRSILQLVEVGQRTGQPCVEPYGSPSGQVDSSRSAEISWFVFFLNGQIIYATRSDIQTERLLDHLHRFHLHLCSGTKYPRFLLYFCKVQHARYPL